MNKKIYKGTIVEIHPKIYSKKIPQALSNKIFYPFINQIKNSTLTVVEIFYQRVDESSFYDFVVNSNNKDMIQFRNQLNIDSTIVCRNGYKYILIARINPGNESLFKLPVSFLIKSTKVPLSIY